MNNSKIIKKLMLTLLPVQVLLAVVNTINNIVSSYFASNFVGVDAMTAVGLFGPISMLLNAISVMFAGGCAIICGKYLGQNEHKKLQGVFSLNIIITSAIAILFMLLFGGMALFDLTSIFTKDEIIRPLFNSFLLGQVIGFIPELLSDQLPIYLALENKSDRTLIASIVYIIVNIIFNFLFVRVLHLQEFGVALSSALGLWIFLLVESQYFFSKKSQLKFKFDNLLWSDTSNILGIGFPGAASYLYQTLRGFLVNGMLQTYIGSIAISAYTGANNLMGLFWAIPQGMVAVTRLLIGISTGEEDRKGLIEIMKNVFKIYIPLMIGIDILIILCANPLTYFLFKDTSSEVFRMTASGLRIFPICMSFSILCMQFTCYGQAMNKKVYINTLAILDGVIGSVVCSYLLIGWLGIDAVYIANTLNGIITTLYIIGYAWYKNKKMPKSVEDLMVIPKDFGAKEEDTIDFTLTSKEEVLNLSQKIQDFCKEKGIDYRRSYFASLALEEMAGNIVDHGFKKDKKNHSVDVRVVYKDNQVILCIKDDCVPFNPKERLELTSNQDPTKNIGLRMVYKIAKDIDYQNMIGLNVLRITI